MASHKLGLDQVARIRGRQPGEIAFDRCFFPSAALFVLSIIAEAIEWSLYSSKPLTENALASQVPPSPWIAWGWFGLGLILLVLWIRAVVTLVRAWGDPSSRVLRFSAVVLLIPFAAVTCGHLLTPFH